MAQIRLNATMTQNVVTYTVVVATDNPDGSLLPYLTANLQFEIDQRHDVLLVPNAALRWQPRPEQIVPGGRAAFDHGATPDAGARDHGVVWVQEQRFVRPIAVQPA